MKEINYCNSIAQTFEERIMHFDQSLLIALQDIAAHKLILFLTALVEFLVPGFKAAQWQLSLMAKLHFSQSMQHLLAVPHG